MVDVIWFFIGIHGFVLLLLALHAILVVKLPAPRVLCFTSGWQLLYSLVIQHLSATKLEWQDPVLIYVAVTALVGFMITLFLDIKETWRLGKESTVTYTEVPETPEDGFTTARKFHLKQAETTAKINALRSSESDD